MGTGDKAAGILRHGSKATKGDKGQEKGQNTREKANLFGVNPWSSSHFSHRMAPSQAERPLVLL
jgi:hypothetical protein